MLKAKGVKLLRGVEVRRSIGVEEIKKPITNN